MRNTSRLFTSFLVLSALAVLSACNDMPAPTAASDIGPGHAQPTTRALQADSSHDSRSILRIFEEALDRDPGQFASASRSQSWTLRQDGAKAMRSASDLLQVFRRQGTALGHATLGLLADGGTPLSIMAIAIVQPYLNHLHFISSSQVNRTDQVLHSMVGARSVSALEDGYPAVELFRTTDSVSFYASGGIASYAWDEFKATSGCSFLGTLWTKNSARWPANGYVPSGIVTTVRDNAGGDARLTRTCTPPTTPPPPTSSEPLCDDAVATNCPTPNPGGATGGSGEYSGPPVPRDMGYTGKWKIVCEVTDWYVNGVFVETVVDRCWKELA